MTKNIFIALVVLCFLSSCKSKDAFNYSQDFVTKERAMIPDIDSTEDRVSRYADAGLYDSITVASTVMEKKFDVVIDGIKEKPAPDCKDGEHFKSEVIKYFDYMRSIYTAYKDFGNAPEDGREAVRTRISDIVAQKPQVLADIKQAQNEFADANGFTVEKTY
jgi:hypothetical protein